MRVQAGAQGLARPAPALPAMWLLCLPFPLSAMGAPRLAIHLPYPSLHPYQLLPAAMHTPLAALLAHLGLAALAWNPLYCTTAALAAPLARQRQAALARLLDVLCMPLGAVQPIVGQLPTSFEGERRGLPACYRQSCCCCGTVVRTCRAER